MLELSGYPNTPAKMFPSPLSSAVDGAILALKSLSSHPELLPQNGSLLLGERARLMGLKRNSNISAGGYCRLIRAKNGHFAVSLARDDDWGLLEAWLEQEASSWDDIARIARLRDTKELVERGCELGLAIAWSNIPQQQSWFKEISFLKTDNSQKLPLVVDLSSLWAGPLLGNLLHLMGANVVKVESLSRTDGARRGNAEFYKLLNAGKHCAAFDFTSADGLSDLKRLIVSADIVIEASRPRALKQLGIEAERMLQQKPGKLWLRLIAHGAEQDRIGFGDDIGVSAGLTTIMEKAWGKPCFVGDAIADPISGVFGALAAWSIWKSGGGSIVNLSMRDAVRYAIQARHENINWSAIALEWQTIANNNYDDLYPMRQTYGKAEEVGESTSFIMSNLC